MAMQGLAEAAGPFWEACSSHRRRRASPLSPLPFRLLVVPLAVLYASAPKAGKRASSVGEYTPFTRFLSRADLRAHAWHLSRTRGRGANRD